MQFSQFGDFLAGGSGIVQLMEDLGGAAHSEQPVYMLGGGNPGAIPQIQTYLQSAMANLLKQPDLFNSMTGSYDSPNGDAGFRQAIASFLNDQYGWQISLEHIAVTNGSQSSFFTLFNTFSGQYADGKQRKILLPLTPEYIGYTDTGFGKDLFVSNQPTIELLDDHMFKYHVDLPKLNIDEQIGAVCVSRPTNPTGNVLTNQEIEILRHECRTQGIPLIIDGAYGTPFPNIIFTEAVPIWDHGIILCLSLSKLGLPGVRTGIVIADPALIQVISASNAILSLAPGSFGPSLLTEAVNSGDIKRLSDNYVKPFYFQKVQQTVSLLHERLRGLPYHIHQPEGAIFLWLWLEDLPITSNELYNRLKQRGVYVIAGEHFFPGLPDNGQWRHRHECLRLSYAQDIEVVTKGLEIIEDEVRKAYSESL
ncbi:MAG: valine--pyruvate aminotransferase [Parasphingorhabdus sp.]